MKYATRFILTAFCIAISSLAKSQECGNCKEVPKLTQFDFDIQVPQPNAADGTENLWPEWKNLFMLASSVSIQIQKANGNCLRITIPPSIDTGTTILGSVGGETFVNLPSNPFISADLSDYGDYLLTGMVTSEGPNCKLHVEVQASCRRKVVASADVSFSLSSFAGNVSGIAQQVAAQLAPLSQKIRTFELEERENNPSLSLLKTNWEEPIKIVLQKKTLKGGETTSFTVEARDCDGFPLAGREIIFTADSFGGMKIPGTLGGTVSPVKVITDANGNAKANFILRPGAEQAIIAAHSLGNDVKGCRSLLFGDAAVNIIYTYSGYVTYTFQNKYNCQEQLVDECSFRESRSSHSENIEYRASFYAKPPRGETVFSVGSEDEEGSGLEVPDILEAGSLSIRKFEFKDHVITCLSAQMGRHITQRTLLQSSGTLNHGQIHFELPSASGGGGIKLYLDIDQTDNFISSVTMQPELKGSDQVKSTHQFEAEQGIDKEFTFKQELLPDKIRYTISGTRTTTGKCGTITATVKAVIIQE